MFIPFRPWRERFVHKTTIMDIMRYKERIKLTKRKYPIVQIFVFSLQNVHKSNILPILLHSCQFYYNGCKYSSAINIILRKWKKKPIKQLHTWSKPSWEYGIKRKIKNASLPSKCIHVYCNTGSKLPILNSWSYKWKLFMCGSYVDLRPIQIPFRSSH